MTTLNKQIAHFNPCSEAADWLADRTDAVKAWRECERGDWMLWLLGKQITSPPWSEDRKPLLACALDCALTVQHLWPREKAAEMTQAVKTLRDWIAGKATAALAKDAVKAIENAADSYAAYTIVEATYAATAAAYAIVEATYAYTAATFVGDRSSAKNVLLECADIVRRHFPDSPSI